MAAHIASERHRFRPHDTLTSFQRSPPARKRCWSTRTPNASRDTKPRSSRRSADFQCEADVRLRHSGRKPFERKRSAGLRPAATWHTR